jgi:hypothetical protein
MSKKSPEEMADELRNMAPVIDAAFEMYAGHPVMKQMIKKLSRLQLTCAVINGLCSNPNFEGTPEDVEVVLKMLDAVVEKFDG